MRWNEEDIRRFGSEVAGLIAEYYTSLDTRPIAVALPGDIEDRLGGPLPEEGTDPFALLAEVRERVIPASFHLASPRYFGLFNPTPTVIGVFADAIASMLNQNMGAWSHGRSGTLIEKTVIRWLCDLAGYGAGAWGTLTSGGTLANVTALKVALSEKFPSSRQEGVAALPGRPTFYVSDQAHFSLARTADLLGLGLAGIRRIPSDALARIDLARLRDQIAADRAEGRLPFCVVGIAGTTTSGAIDPLDELADLCAREGLWYHVDAAWGGAARLSRQQAPLVAGMARADSITLDPHKWFSVPFTAGAVIVRDGAALGRTFASASSYLSDKAFSEHVDLNFFQQGVAGTRRLDALKVWLSLRQHGRRGYEAAVDRQVALAARLAAAVAAAPDFTAAGPASLGVFCFRYLPVGYPDDAALDELHREVQFAIEQRGRLWISTSLMGGRRVFRFCATSYLAREADVDEVLPAIREAGGACSAPLLKS